MLAGANLKALKKVKPRLKQINSKLLLIAIH